MNRKRPADGPSEDEPSSKLTFAQRYMEKYGYEEGKGLGRNEHGIVEPIKAVGHTKRRGWGDEKGKVSFYVFLICGNINLLGLGY